MLKYLSLFLCFTGFLYGNELATSYYDMGRYSEVIELLGDGHSPEDFFLLGIAYRNLGEYKKSISFWKKYLQEKGAHLEKGRFEMGQTYFKWGKIEKAKELFEEDHSPQGQLYKVRIAIYEGNYEEAKQKLRELEKNESLPFAVAYLYGEIHYRQKDFAKAVVYFEQALPKKNEERAVWLSDTLYHLGMSYLNIGYLDKAESIFKKREEDRLQLALAQTHLLQGHKKKALKLLDKSPESLLLRAEAVEDWKEKRKIYEQLTDSSSQGNPFYAKGWYLRGLNAIDYDVDDAIASLEKAFSLLYPKDKTLAALSLKFQAEAYTRLNNREGNLKALSLLNGLINQFGEELLSSLEEPGEIYYLHGLIASHLSEANTDDAFFEIAEKSLLEGMKCYPRGPHAIDSRMALGILYYQHGLYSRAEAEFLDLAEDFSDAPQAGEALFWAASCIEAEEGDQNEVKKIYRQVYEEFPDSRCAAEAYFRLYTTEDYLQGKKVAMAHLKQMGKKFPESPYLALAHYFQGLNYLKRDDLRSAIKNFKKTEQMFDRVDIPSELSDLRHRARFERAMAHRKGNEIEEAILLLKGITESLESAPPIVQKSAYWLAQLYVETDQKDEARELLATLFHFYQKAKITRNYYLSRSHYESGMLHKREGDYQNALKNLEKAEEAGGGHIISIEELLDLWIEQSHCLRSLNKMDRAMLVLSRVINTGAISSLRIKAMYLRAEIYEDQGRQELARKQLEATATKGGVWAAKAKQKLEENYVFN